MTDKEKAIVSAYTGVTMLAGDKFQIFHEYIEKILGRPVWTHELGNELVWNEIKEKSKDDFIEICKSEDKPEEKPQGEWILIEPDCRGYTEIFECSCCKERIYRDHCMKRNDYPNCPYCLADMQI